MTKKTKQHTAAPRLIDPSKKGTVILGNYRTGSHFIAKLAVETAQTHGQSVRFLDEHMAWDSDVRDEFMRLDRTTDYVVMIVNHPDLKIGLMNDQHLLDRWHVVRTVNHDLYRWFISYYIMMNPDSEINLTIPPTSFRMNAARLNGREVLFYGDAHTGLYMDLGTREYLCSWNRSEDRLTVRPDLRGMIFGTNHLSIWRSISESNERVEQIAQEMLLRWQRTYRPITLTPNDFRAISAVLFGMHASMSIAVDEEIDYAHMHHLASKTISWQPNLYVVSKLSLGSLFTNGDFLVDILGSWNVSKNGRFKSV